MHSTLNGKWVWGLGERVEFGDRGHGVGAVRMVRNAV